MMRMSGRRGEGFGQGRERSVVAMVNGLNNFDRVSKDAENRLIELIDSFIHSFIRVMNRLTAIN